MTSTDTSAFTQKTLDFYPAHKWLFIGLNVGLTVINIIGGAPWWALWPLLVTGLLFSIHFFIYKSVTIDEDWAEERTDEIRWRSYDLGHVEDMETRIVSDDFSTRPAHRRDRDWWMTPEEKEAKAAELSQKQSSSASDVRRS